MRALLLGKKAEKVRAYFSQFKIKEVKSNPQVIITYGGDGTLVGAECKYPGIPKVPIRSKDHCLPCPEHTIESILGRLVRGKLPRQLFPKVEMRWHGKRKVGLNEVGVHITKPASAVRFRLYVNGQPYVAEEIIGDGMVVASAFGSTAYFRSLTQGSFRQGLGLAIVNSTNPIHWAVLRETDTIRMEIDRGPALGLADNDPDHWKLEAGSIVEFSAHKKKAVILGFDSLGCTQCVLTPPRPPR